MSFIRPPTSRVISKILSLPRHQPPSSLISRRRISSTTCRPNTDARQTSTSNESDSLAVTESGEPHVPSISTTHQPDWGAEIDSATSTFSPVPKRVLDGSEPGETLPAAVVSGAPIDLQARTVRIYQPARPATQSGTWGSHAWRIDWDILPKGNRWENPLMGWQSSADFMQGYKVQFSSKEDAIAFAQKQGYEYYVQEPNERRFVPKAYANNFVHEPKTLKHIKTK